MAEPITEETLDAILADVVEANRWYHASATQNVLIAAPTLVAEVQRLREELSWYKRVYSLFDNMAPPDIPRDRFVAMCFDAWEKQDGLNEEILRLREWIADMQESHSQVMAEQCAPDEQHCTCVPLLRAEVRRLREALKQIADATAWVKGYDTSDTIYDMAQAALGQQGAIND